MFTLREEPFHVNEVFHKTQYWVEADDDASLYIFKKNSNQIGSKKRKRYEFVQKDCKVIFIGNLHGLIQVSVQIKWYIIDGILVGFYCSNADVVC
jgi:hypothetical protein